MPTTGSVGVCLALLASSTLAATLESRDGAPVSGEVSITETGLEIRVGESMPRVVGWERVRRARFKPAPTFVTLSNASWHSQDVGEVALPGTTVLLNDRVLLQTSGWGCLPPSDAFRFAGVPMNGDGSIVARPLAWHESNGTVFAGITLRTDLSKAAAHASLLMSSTGRVVFLARGDTNFVRREFNGSPDRPQLRLSRVGDLVTGYVSKEARSWEPVEHIHLSSTGAVYAGVIGCTAINAFVGAVEVGDVKVMLGVDAESTDLPAPCVVLRDGSIFAGAVSPADDGVHWVRGSLTNVVPLRSLAAVIWKPIDSNLALQSAGGLKTGVVLSNRDWLEGEVTSWNDDRLTVTSPVLGAKNIDWGQRPAAVVLAAVAPPASGWLVVLGDRSRLTAADLAGRPGALVVSHSILGRLEIESSDLVELRRW